MLVEASHQHVEAVLPEKWFPFEYSRRHALVSGSNAALQFIVRQPGTLRCFS